VEEELIGRYGAPMDSVISRVTVRVSGCGSAVFVTVRVTTTVEGFPSIMVVRVVVTVAADCWFVCVATSVFVVGFAEEAGTPKSKKSAIPLAESTVSRCRPTYRALTRKALQAAPAS
jgi:hypothetical protein